MSRPHNTTGRLIEEIAKKNNITIELARMLYDEDRKRVKVELKEHYSLRSRLRRAWLALKGVECADLCINHPSTSLQGKIFGDPRFRL